MTMKAAELAIRKTVTVDCSVEHAFEVFTDRLGDWWPLETHSVGAMTKDGTPQTARFKDGELVEVMADGTEAHWADVLEWDPPRKLVLAWKVNPNAAAATDVAVTFTPEGDGTRVELVHNGWERLGDDAQAGFESYSAGWEGVVPRYVEAAGK